MPEERRHLFETEGGGYIVLGLGILSLIIGIVVWPICFWSFDLGWIGSTWRAGVPPLSWIGWVAINLVRLKYFD